MQQVTPWPSSFDVSEPVARVLVDGTEVEVESVSVESELGSAMPERVVAGGGLVASTGDTTILRSQDVSEAGLNPWGDAGRLAGATEIVVEAGYRDNATGEVGCARQLTGQVDSLDGSALAAGVGMEVMDRTPSLDREITIEPLMQMYPPREDHGPLIGAGLSSFYVLNRVLRHCGFYSTPPLINQALVSAPLFGGGVAERGTLMAARGSGGRVPAAYFETPWGMGLSGGELTYAPNFGSRGHGRLTSMLHVSFVRGINPDGATSDSSVDLQWGSWADAINVYVAASGTVRVRYRTNQVATTVVAMQAGQAEGAETFNVLVSPSGEATIYASNGASATGSLGLPPRVTSQSLSEVIVRVEPEGHRLGGVQVAYGNTRNDRFARTAHIESPVYWVTTALPFMLNANCLDLVLGFAEAELAAVWIDEAGHFRWRNRAQLRRLSPLATLTSTDNLFDLPWEFPVRSVFSTVRVEHDVPTITRRSTPTVTVSDSRGSSLENGDTEDKFFEPPADEDWHMVDPPQWMGGTVNHVHLRRARGSYRGGVVADDEDNERLAYSSRLSQSWEQINPQRWLMSSQATGLSSDEYIEQRFLDRPTLYGRFNDEGLPLIRAKGLVQWNTEHLTSAEQGPTWAPEFTHKVGPWVQNQQALGYITDYLGEHLTKPEPVLRDIQIVPDPRIQLGDAFWLVDQTAFHVRLRVIVMGKKLTYQTSTSGSQMTQSITCRVVDVQRLKVSYDDLTSEWIDQDYQALQDAWDGRDYETFADDPLDRS